MTLAAGYPSRLRAQADRAKGLMTGISPTRH
jgi:hypothetical protein